MNTKEYEDYKKQKREHMNLLVKEYREIYDSIPANREMTEEEDKRIIEIVRTMKALRDGPVSI